jgi:hypothetical protein
MHTHSQCFFFLSFFWEGCNVQHPSACEKVLDAMHPTPPPRGKNRAHHECMLSLPVGCMTFLFTRKPYYLWAQRVKNIKQAKGNELHSFHLIFSLKDYQVEIHTIHTQSVTLSAGVQKRYHVTHR